MIELGTKKQKQEIDLTWEQIGTICGNIPGERARDRFKKYRQRNGLIKNDKPFDKKLEEMKIERYAIQQEKNELKKYERDYARTEILAERIDKAIIKLDKLDRVKPFVRMVDSQKELIACYSDSQIGELVLPEEIDNLNEFNIDILKDRTYKYFNQVRQIALENNITKINILLLGDLLEGLKIFKNQRASLEEEPIEQIFIISEMLANTINELSKEFLINVVGVIGNHGTISYSDARETTNYELLVFKFLELRLQGNPNVKLDLNKSIIRVVNIQGYNCLLYHGDKIKNKENAVLRFKDMLQDKYGKIHYVFMAHWHEFEMNSDYIVNGCLVGGNLYSLKRLQSMSKPMQVCVVMKKDVGKYCTYEVVLD